MALYGYWNLSSSFFDAVVTGKDEWRFQLELPGCGGLRAEMPDFNAMAPRPEERRNRELPAGSAVRVALNLSYDERNGFELSANEERARLAELAAAQKHCASTGGAAYVVSAVVFEKMTGALGLYILSAPYQGLRGVVRRVGLPGRTSADQHAFAGSVAIGQEFFCRLENVSDDTMAHWQATLNLRNVEQSERLPDVSEPAGERSESIAPRRFRPLGEAAVQAAVVDRVGPVVRLVFNPEPARPHCRMILNLRWRNLCGLSSAEKQERFNRLVKGDVLTVTPEIIQSKTLGMEVRALERPALIASLRQSTEKGTEHLLQTVQVKRVYARKAQVTVLSADGRGLAAWLATSRPVVVGETLPARLLAVSTARDGQPYLQFTDQLLPASADSGKGWRLIAA